MPGLDVYYGADFCYIAREQKANHPALRLTPRYQHLFAFEKAVFGTNSQTLILSLSEREKKVFQEYYHTPDSRFSLLPPTLNLVDRMPVQDRSGTQQRIREEFEIAGDALLLLFIGSGFETKGLDRAIRALASLPSDLQKRSQLMVIGQDHSEEYQQLAKQLGVRRKVHFPVSYTHLTLPTILLV